ncbi:hypothetical protein Aph01nite_10350 [Acrocarpospora phusangensis]|uniref:Uncharacterized protein n=1 Tax=Acrocarpospora phusangensis TaxID=1070424 RepID=A0A919Q8P2_9ACTN|nr:hypothetical protein [Acrocarpospora phusangensis]GIH22725.1 hypothetical protein Aph01nite_10350 [Acrocarpospora phusangensis]
MGRARRVIAGSILVAGTAGSWWLAGQARTPQALAAQAEPPAPSVITVPVRWERTGPVIPVSALQPTGDRARIHTNRGPIQIDVVKEAEGWLSISAPPGSIRPGDQVRVWPR